jgi:5-methylcytosine-specific restriction endonuclease McrA
VSAEARKQWLDKASRDFVSPSESNKAYYTVILEELWPAGHGIPGPIRTENDLRAAIDRYRGASGKDPYKDVFRRVRELQGDEGFKSINKEGTRYQLTSLQVSVKREPRAKPPAQLWRSIKSKADYRCSHCGAQEPDVKLSPDHRVPRDRGGSNADSNWQPLCKQCNILKSSACQGCQLNCYVCSWAYPETYKPITLSDDNKEQIRRAAEKAGLHQSDLVNQVLRSYFNAKS